MKKVSKLLVCLTAVVCAALTLTACGGVEGKYKTEITQQGLTVEMTLELKSGGKFVQSGKIKGEVPDELKDYIDEMETSVEGTYKIDGEKITFTTSVNGSESTTEGTIKDGVINLQGMEFKK